MLVLKVFLLLLIKGLSFRGFDAFFDAFNGTLDAFLPISLSLGAVFARECAIEDKVGDYILRHFTNFSLLAHSPVFFILHIPVVLVGHRKLEKFY